MVNKFICILIFVSSFVLVTNAEPSLDSFSVELSYLEQRDPLKEGVFSIIEAYEALIARHRSDERVALAMFKLAMVYESSGPHQDYNKSLEWLGEAARVASPNSDIWTKVNFFLFNRILYHDPIQAEKILSDMEGQIVDDDFMSKMEVEEKYMYLSFEQGSLDKAEEHYCKVVEIYNSSKFVDTVIHDNSKIADILGSSSIGIISCIKNYFSVPVEDRIIRLHNLKQKNYIISLYPFFDKTLKELESKVDESNLAIIEEQFDSLVSLNNNSQDANIDYCPDIISCTEKGCDSEKESMVAFNDIGSTGQSYDFKRYIWLLFFVICITGISIIALRRVRQ